MQNQTKKMNKSEEYYEKLLRTELEKATVEEMRNVYQDRQKVKTMNHKTLEDVEEATNIEFDKECEDCKKQYTSHYRDGFLEAMRCAEIIVRTTLKTLKI